STSYGGHEIRFQLIAGDNDRYLAAIGFRPSSSSAPGRIRESQRPRIESANPASGAWTLSKRVRPDPPLRKPCLTPGGAESHVPGPARTASSPTVNSTSPSSTKNESA